MLLTAALALVCTVAPGFFTTFAQVIDLSGNVVDPLKTEGNKAVVLVFVRTDCPISNRYALEVKRIAEKYAPDKIKVYLIYAGADETADAIQQHLRAYDYNLAALRDPNHQLVKTTGVKVTPEAAVFVQGKQVYRGRIDNRFVAFGKLRPAPTTRDLEQTLEAVSKGRTIMRRTTTAIGCFIS